jgi:O-antigen/teichoic acid export membrane protein
MNSFIYITKNMKNQLNIFSADNLKIVMGQCVVSAGNFISTVVLVRALELEIFGQFSSIWLVVLFSSTIVMSVCILPMMSDYYHLDVDQREKYIAGTFGTLLSGAALLILAVSFIYLALFISESGKIVDYIWPTTFCILSINLQDFVRRALITMSETTLAFSSDFVTHISRVVVLLILWDFGLLDIHTALTTFYLSGLIGTIFFMRPLKVDKKILDKTHFAWQNNRISAKWLFLSGILQWTSINIFIVAAAFFISPAAVGIIRICQSLLAILNVILQSTENIISTHCTKVFKNFGEIGLSSYMLKVSLLGCLPFLVVILISIFWGDDIVFYVYGYVFEQSSKGSLVLYSIAYFFIFLAVPVRAVLRTLGKARSWFNAYLASSVFSLLSVYFLEVNYGVYGAVWGILIAQIVLLFGAYFSLYGRFRHAYKIL